MNELLTRIANRAFELDVFEYSIIEITTQVNEEFSEELAANYKSDSQGNPPHFTEEMVQTLIEYVNIDYMMATAHKPQGDK